MFSIHRLIVESGNSGWCTSCGTKVLPPAVVWVLNTHDLGGLGNHDRHYWLCSGCIKVLRNHIEINTSSNPDEKKETPSRAKTLEL